jgi:hypothetical protein
VEEEDDNEVFVVAVVEICLGRFRQVLELKHLLDGMVLERVNVVRWDDSGEPVWAHSVS